MRLKQIGVLLALLIASFGAQFAAAAPSVPVTQQQLKLIDLTDDFARIWDQTSTLPDAQRAAQFKSRFAAILPGFYDHHRLEGKTEAQYDERLLRRLKRYPEQRASIEKVSREFNEKLKPAVASFAAQFGSMSGYAPVYLVNSLGEFDGGTRDLPEGNRLLFGGDVIAEIHGSDDLAPFFHHELFHVYHRRQVNFDACDQIWCAVWGEGLAVYVAQRLNPKATDSELLLTSPEPIRPTIDAHKVEAICTTVAKLDSRGGDDFGAMFSNGRLGPNLPPRFGYYIGYLVAKDIGRTRSLKQLAKLQGPPLRALIGRSLARMAACPGATASGERG